MAIRIDVVVGVIDRGDESPAFIPFVGMLVGSCFKETLASEFAQCQVSGQMSGKMRYSLQTWPRRAARAGSPPRVPGGPAGGQDRGCDPNHRLRHPPRWCGSGATQRNLPDCRSVIPFWGCTCRTWGKSPDFGPRDQIVVVSEGRSDN